MSRGKGGRYMVDEDDHYDDDNYDDDYDRDGSGHEEEVSDYVANIRSKLNAEQNKKLTDYAIITQLEIDDYNIEKTLRVLRDRLKSATKPATKPPTTTAGAGGKNSPKDSTSAANTKPAAANQSKGASSQVSTPAPASATGASTNNHPVAPTSSSSGNSKRPVNVSISSPTDLDIGIESETTSFQTSAAASASVDDENKEEEVVLVVVGHVDSGKSTLVGHLLQKIGLVQARTVQKYEQSAQSIGKASFGLAWVTDEREDEREHGVTIDIAERHFVTSRRKYSIVDTPGHRDFMPNMIKGATQADVALLLLPASTGEYESAMKDSAQTKEHCFLLKAMGVKHIVLVVNKMDQTSPVAWDYDRYMHIVQDMVQFLTRDLHFAALQIHAVPVSGLTGENLVDISEESTRQALQWYLQPSSVSKAGNSCNSADFSSGRTLVATLDEIVLPAMKQALQKSFRAVANLLDEHAGRLQVHVLQGSVQRGDKIGLSVTLPGIMMASTSNHHGTNAAGATSDAQSTGTMSTCRLYSGIIRSMVPAVHPSASTGNSNSNNGNRSTSASSANASEMSSLERVGPRDHVIMHIDFLSSSFAGLQYPSHYYAGSNNTVVANPFAAELAEDMDMVLFRGPTLPSQTCSFQATISLMPILRVPILPGTACELYLLGVEMPCKITALLSVTSPIFTTSSDNSVSNIQLRPKMLRDGGRTATVTIEIASSSSSFSSGGAKHEILVDRFTTCRALGRFALRAKGFTIAVGVIDDFGP